MRYETKNTSELSSLKVFKMSFGVFSEFMSIDNDDFSTEMSWTKKETSYFL
ncbi:predicted protein [Enterococcus faecium 1,141,733]|nr:predicted protein [Enterococcus faecium 1,141,733]